MISEASVTRSVEQIWCDVLADPSPQQHDVNFFDAGGTSLGLLRMQALLNERFGLELSGVDLFEHTTIEKLSRHIGALTSA